jgi:PD-(D/E)XK nuclease superfamily
MLNEQDYALIEEWSKKLHWVKIAEDGIVEFVLDNHMLQDFRACEAHFWESLVRGHSGKGRVWFLDLGTCVHKMMEIYYTAHRWKKFYTLAWAKIGIELWHLMDMEYYKTCSNTAWQKNYNTLGGPEGFVALLVQYAYYYSGQQERLRVVGTELYFGRGKEVPILDDPYKYRFAPFRLYLSGKIDLLIDDGRSIGPMDHKTRAAFKGDPTRDYELQDGMTGYIYAAQKLLKHFPDVSRMPCNKIWMNHISISPTKVVSDRFRRTPIRKTDAQIEQYKQRQIRTASKILSLLINPDMSPDYDTTKCTNWMRGECAFLSAHRQSSHESQLIILQQDFPAQKIWNPEEIDSEETEVNNLVNKEIERLQESPTCIEI